MASAAAKEHPLASSYEFWFMRRARNSRAEPYDKGLKPMGEFNTVEGFWDLYSHMVRPNDVAHSSDWHLFKKGIKPMWEDDANKHGGKWMVRLRKGLASVYWEEVLLALIGEQFPVGADELCGVVLSVRYSEDVLSVWTRDAADTHALSAIRDTLRRVLRLPGFVSLEYKRHDSSNARFKDDDERLAPEGGGDGDRDRRGDSHPRERLSSMGTDDSGGDHGSGASGAAPGGTAAAQERESWRARRAAARDWNRDRAGQRDAGWGGRDRDSDRDRDRDRDRERDRTGRDRSAWGRSAGPSNPDGGERSGWRARERERAAGPTAGSAAPAALGAAPSPAAEAPPVPSIGAPAPASAGDDGWETVPTRR